MSPARRRGRGSITRESLPSGLVSYRAQISVGGQRKVARRRTREAAEQWLRDMEQRADRLPFGAPLPDVRVTYADLAPKLRAFWGAAPDRQRTPATLESYELELRDVLRVWGKRRVLATTTGDVDQYVAELRARGLSTSSIRHRLDRLSQLHRVGIREGLYTVACPIGRPKMIQRDEPEALAEGPYLRLAVAALELADPRHAAVVLLAGDAGLRRSEILRLRGADVRLTGWDGRAYGTIRVASESAERRTKSGRGRAVPILTERLHDALRACWPSARGLLLRDASSRERLETLARRAYRAAGLEPRRGELLHVLRHRFGTWLADRGVAPKVIREWMGHRSLATTQRYLTRKTDTVPAGAAEAPKLHTSTTSSGPTGPSTTEPTDP